MTAAAQKQIIAQALALPRKVRSRLRDQLEKSLEEPAEKLSRKEWNEAWETELEKRSEEIRSGKVKCVPHAEVRKRIEKLLRRR